MIMETEVGRQVKGPQMLKCHRTTQHLQTVALWYEEYAGNNQINDCLRAYGYKLILQFFALACPLLRQKEANIQRSVWVKVG
jgi:hypothetical protein